MFEIDARVIMKCDNPACQVEFTWKEITEQEAQRGKTPDIPDGAYRFLIFSIPFGQEKFIFCSKYCLLEYLKTFVPRKSPAEQLEDVELQRLAVAEKEKQAAKIESLVEDGEISRMVGEGGLG